MTIYPVRLWASIYLFIYIWRTNSYIQATTIQTSCPPPSPQAEHTASASSFASFVPSLIHSSPCGAPSNSANLASAVLSQNRSRTSELMLRDRLGWYWTRSMTLFYSYEVLSLIELTDGRAFAHTGTAVPIRKAGVLKLSFGPLSILRGAQLAMPLSSTLPPLLERAMIDDAPRLSLGMLPFCRLYSAARRAFQVSSSTQHGPRRAPC